MVYFSRYREFPVMRKYVLQIRSMCSIGFVIQPKWIYVTIYCKQIVFA